MSNKYVIILLMKLRDKEIEMIKLIFDDMKDTDITIKVAPEASIHEAFEAIYRAWMCATYLDSQFQQVCEDFATSGEESFFV